jgi:polysaccharide export outer membrane protein
MRTPYLILKRALPCSAALLLCLAPGQLLRAQFNGPALPASVNTNAPQPPTTDQSLLLAHETDPVLHPGDLINVQIFGSPNYSPPVRVTVDGSVQLPLVGIVPVAGLTVIRAEDLIASRLADAGMFNNPQVTVQIAEAATQFATVYGEIRGIVPISGERRLFDVLAAVSTPAGLPATASHTVTILRKGVDKPIIVDIGTNAAASAQADIVILPGDKILISRVGVVYMIGAFKVQGAIPLQQNSPLTLMQATALSQGAGFEGRYNDLRIIRTTGLTRSVVQVDLRQILNGHAPDPVLQTDDIVFLPTDNLKAAIKGGGINVIASIGSLLVLALQDR